MSHFLSNEREKNAASFDRKCDKSYCSNQNFPKSTILKSRKNGPFWWFLGIILVKDSKSSFSTLWAIFLGSFGTFFVNEPIADSDFLIRGSEDFPRSFPPSFFDFFYFSKIIIRSKMTLKNFYWRKSIPMQLLHRISIKHVFYDHFTAIRRVSAKFHENSKNQNLIMNHK